MPYITFAAVVDNLNTRGLKSKLEADKIKKAAENPPEWPKRERKK